MYSCRRHDRMRGAPDNSDKKAGAGLQSSVHSMPTVLAWWLTGRRCEQVPRRDTAPRDTIDESRVDSFLGAEDWSTGSLSEPGPRAMTDR